MEAAMKQAQKTPEEIKREETVKGNCDRICGLVLQQLGRQAGFVKATATHINRNAYRVNVYVQEKDTTSCGLAFARVRIAHSFFVIEKAGKIISDPVIKPV